MAESELPNMAATCNQDLVGSRYALEVAFQTMKERCQRLQQRLAKVEEENSKLQVQKRREEVTQSSKGYEEVDSMRDKIAELERQKQQLTHHVLMVTSENKQLWTRLSQSAKLNQSLGSQLTKISDTLNRHSATANLTSQHSSSAGVSSTREALRNSSMLGQLPKSKETNQSTGNTSSMHKSIKLGNY